MKRLTFLLVLAVITITTSAQWNYYNQYGLLSESELDEFIGEASGEQAFNHIIEMSAYNRVRPLEEYAGMFEESKYVLQKLKEYGIESAKVEIVGETSTWKGLKGRLWEIEHRRAKIVDYDDLPLFLASGSNNADVEAELVWIGDGKNINMDAMDLKGKIGVTSGSLRNLNSLMEKGLLGLLSFESSRTLIDPLQIPTGGMRGSGSSGFAFRVPPRAGHKIRDRLLKGEKIKVHAEVETTRVEMDMEVPTCVIEGTDPGGDEIILCAHIYEGYVKQGANDNISGSAALLEMARMLQTMYNDGRLERPKRNIRFIWIPEFSGTIPWVNKHADIMERTLCNINLDMVGLKMMENQSRLNMHRTTMGNPHYINDVMQCYMRYISENNIIRCTPTGRHPFLKPIVAPTGTDDPFAYSIEAYIGASDHAVFNDWAVGVPGICLNNWPDHYYHTSNDRPWVCDPTQMKRVAFLGAAAAYSIAIADDQVGGKVAAEVFGNAQHRIGHQLTISSRNILDAAADQLAEVYKKAFSDMQAVSMNELETLGTVAELLSKGKTDESLESLSKALKMIENNNLIVLNSQMKARAAALGIMPAKISVTGLEKKALKIVPVLTSKVKENGYGGYRTVVTEAIKKYKAKYPHKSVERYLRELQLLCSGNHNALDIKKIMDVQQPANVELQDVINYIMILELAGLVTIGK